jgi:hypothetical protein
MISGYLCGWHYEPELRGNSTNIRKRLATRALQIFSVFLFLNIFLYSTGIALSIDRFLAEINSLGDIFSNFLLNVNGRLAAFEILYYIAMLLILVSIILGRFGITPLCIMILVMVLLGPSCGLTWFTTFGLTGLLGGILANRGYFVRVWALLEQTYGLPVMIVLLLYQICVYGRWTINGHRSSFVLYSFEIITWSLSCVFLLRLRFTKKVGNVVALLGRYTLFAYIFQMFLIRMNNLLLSRMNIAGLHSYIVNLFVCSLTLFLLVFICDRMRQKIKAVDIAYTSIFE